MRGRMQRRSFQAFLEPDSDISFISSGRPSTEHSLPMAYDFIDVSQPARLSASSELGYGSQSLGIKFNDRISHEFSSISQECSESGTSCSFSSQNLVSLKFESSTSELTGILGKLYECIAILQDEVEAEMRRLKLELKQTMDMYSTACKEALLSKQQVVQTFFSKCFLR